MLVKEIMEKWNSIVIPVAKSKIDYLDLKYALRSVDKFLSGYGDIFLIGEKPKWAKNIIHIPYSEIPSEIHKERNILNKIKFACYADEITNDFIFMNDDHFFISPKEGYSEFYYKKDLKDSLNNSSMYRHTMRHTYEYLLENGKKTFNYDTHCPIMYNKRKFLTTFEPIDFNIDFGYGIKSLYANLNDVDGVQMDDLKFVGKNTLEDVEKKCENRHIISCNETSLRSGLGDYLKKMFPKKSRFEI